MHRVPRGLGLCLLIVSLAGQAQGIRDRTRPDQAPATAVNESQAVDLTLTMVETARTALQTWVRTAASLDESGKKLTACVRDPDAGLIMPGQRVRAFPPDSKSSIYQARISRAEPMDDCVMVEATLSGPTYEHAPRYVMEIIVERGMYLAIPNEAIIEEGDNKQVVYMEHGSGSYMPMEIQTGLKGELYAQVLQGLSEGDRVVTFGSFFIDAEHKLKESGAGGMPGMPGMSGMGGMSDDDSDSKGMSGMSGDDTGSNGMPGVSDGASDSNGTTDAHDDH